MRKRVMRRGSYLLLALLLISGLVLGQPSSPPAGTARFKGLWIGGGPNDGDGGAYISPEGDAYFEDLTTTGAYSPASLDHTKLTTTGSSEGDVLTIVSGSPDWSAPSGGGSLSEGDVESIHILDGTIAAADMGTDSVGSDEIAADAVGSSEIATGAVDTDEIAANAVTDSEVIDALTIDGGTVDNTVIGGTTAAAGAFTTLDASGNTTLSGNLTIGSSTLSDSSGDLELGVDTFRITPANDSETAQIFLTCTQTATDRVWRILSGSAAPNTNFRIYDNTAAAERFTIDGTTGDIEVWQDLTVSGGDLTLGDETFSDYGAGVSCDGEFTVNSLLKVGSNDTQYGKLALFGDGAGSDLGGEVSMRTPADHDDVRELWRMLPYSNAFLFQADTTTVFSVDETSLEFTLENDLDVDGQITAGSGSETLTNADGTINLEVLEQDGATSGQVLEWDGTDWAPGTDDGGSADGTRSIILTAAGGKPQSSNGCAEPAINSDSTVEFWTMAFDKTSDEYAIWSIVLPEDYDGNSLGAEFTWCRESGGTTNSVVWAIQAACMDDESAVSTTSYGTAQSATDSVVSGLTANSIYQISTGTALTIGGDTPTAGDMCVFRVYRDADNGSDDLDDDAELVSVQLTY